MIPLHQLEPGMHYSNEDLAICFYAHLPSGDPYMAVRVDYRELRSRHDAANAQSLGPLLPPDAPLGAYHTLALSPVSAQQVLHMMGRLHSLSWMRTAVRTCREGASQHWLVCLGPVSFHSEYDAILGLTHKHPADPLVQRPATRQQLSALGYL